MMRKVRDPDRALKESPRTAESQFLRFTWVGAVLLADNSCWVGLVLRDVQGDKARTVAKTLPLVWSNSLHHCDLNRGVTDAVHEEAFSSTGFKLSFEMIDQMNSSKSD
jgi:hypothetical protein